MLQRTCRVGSLTVAVGAALATSAAIAAPGHQHGHSNEADPAYEAVEGAAARAIAGRRVAWTDQKGAQDPQVHIKLLGINDFHGQLTAGRLVAGKAVGSAAILATYLKRAASEAPDGAFIIHAGDHVGASPPESARQPPP